MRAQESGVGSLTLDTGVQPAPLGAADADLADDDLPIVLEDDVVFDGLVIDEPRQGRLWST